VFRADAVARLASGLLLLPGVLAIIWFGPPLATVLLGAVVALLACIEYASLARRSSPALPAVMSAAATLVVYAALASGTPLDLALAAALIGLALATVARGRPEEDVLRTVATASFPVVYIGLSLGLAAAIRSSWGPPVLLLPFLTIVASDSLQYYGGRLTGRRKLAPAISPGKTVEGALWGLAAGAIATIFLGRFVFPDRSSAGLALLGLVIACAGIAGDLFESLIKRSVGVKDSSNLIPGHGGMLDRIDALLFAFPAYYLFLRYAGW
jgi:phosphatidate cytidylyltransferase